MRQWATPVSRTWTVTVFQRCTTLTTPYSTDLESFRPSSAGPSTWQCSFPGPHPSPPTELFCSSGPLSAFDGNDGTPQSSPCGSTGDRDGEGVRSESKGVVFSFPLSRCVVGVFLGRSGPCRSERQDRGRGVESEEDQKRGVTDRGLRNGVETGSTLGCREPGARTTRGTGSISPCPNQL